ncbi:MAG TPA: penicillin acylase family protein [Ktedonobacterales bacterium]|nr:penicillin acylase family protein [Ktedonobacterales bacterium]
MSSQSAVGATPGRGSPGASQRRSGRLARGALISLTLIICLVIVLVSAATLYVSQVLPQTSGSLAVAGLQQRVYVARDSMGVPHITAQTAHDVFFAQGYVTAQDRLFQMEFNRRVAGGRLASMFGAGEKNSLISADEFLRTLGFYQSAQFEYDHLDPAVHTELQAYSDGINAFINAHQNTLPLEFTILGIRPSPWTPLDSLAYGRVVSFSLDSTWYIKYTRALVIAKAGPGVASALFPAYPETNPTLMTGVNTAAPVTASTASGLSAATSAVASVTPEQQALYARTPDTLMAGAQVVHDLLGSLRDSIGSNDWVVDGSRTATHMPLLANDPHLGIRMPAIWYEIALTGAGLNVIGFSFPGDPGVVIGHNDHIAWGVTNVGADNSDLYQETLDPKGHPGQYLYKGQWRPLVTRQEKVDVRGGKPVTFTVTSTVHGPIINSVYSDVKSLPPLALKWTALQAGYTFQGFFQLDYATNWQQFLKAVSNIWISQNFVYADTQGNIGYRMSGVLPIRPTANELGPVDGASGQFEWSGYVAQADMPTLYNPPTHIIATANQQIVPPGYPYYVTNSWDQGYRARRIDDLLANATDLTVADFQRIQADVVSVPATLLTPRFIAAGDAAGGDSAKAAALLKGWDGAMTRDSVAASVYEVTAGTLARETIEPVLGQKVYSIYQSNYSSSGVYSVLISLLGEPVAPFFGVRGPANAVNARDVAVAKALHDAYAQLAKQYGPDTSKWTWGTLHTATFEHPLATVSPLNLIFGIAPVTRPGDSVTVSVGGDGDFSANPPSYAQHTVSSMRQIIDLSNFDNSLWVTTTGESGQPFSAHYQDLVPLWDQNQYQSMAFSPGAVAKQTGDMLTLTPA